MTEYKAAYLRLAGTIADAIEEVELLESTLKGIKGELIQAQQETEESIIDG